MKFISFLLAFWCFSAHADQVVLLHGIARGAESMQKIEAAFEKEGYTVLNLNYPSTAAPLEELREYIHPFIEKINIQKDGGQLHFVTHSMGGLVVRAYLQKYAPSNLGRVVMLAPPNQGSEVADFLVRYANPVFKFFYGPAGQQLTTNFNRESLLGPIFYPVGVIMGNRSFDPLSSWVIPGEDDGKVAVEKSKVGGMQAHKIIPTSHVFIMKNDDVIKNSIAFIQTGNFLK